MAEKETDTHDTKISLESQFNDSIATVISHYDLMWNMADGADALDSGTVQRIGRSGFMAAQQADKAFHNLLNMQLEKDHD